MYCIAVTCSEWVSHLRLDSWKPSKDQLWRPLHCNRQNGRCPRCRRTCLQWPYHHLTLDHELGLLFYLATWPVDFDALPHFEHLRFGPKNTFVVWQKNKRRWRLVVCPFNPKRIQCHNIDLQFDSSTLKKTNIYNLTFANFGVWWKLMGTQLPLKRLECNNIVKTHWQRSHFVWCRRVRHGLSLFNPQCLSLSLSCLTFLALQRPGQNCFCFSMIDVVCRIDFQRTLKHHTFTC